LGAIRRNALIDVPIAAAQSFLIKEAHNREMVFGGTMMRARRWVSGLLGLLALALGGCNPLLTTGVTTTTTTSTAPGALTVQLTVTQQNANLAQVSAIFLSHGVAVRFTHDETMACNRVTLLYDSAQGAYVSFIPLVTDASAISCVYTSGKATATVPMTMPNNLAIASPKSGAILDRTVPLSIIYLAVKDKARMTASADNGAGSASISGDSESDSGTYAGLHPDALSVGAGDITLVREVDSAPTGTGFASAACALQTNATIPVQWT
jgi:hypothetical protein